MTDGVEDRTDSPPQGEAPADWLGVLDRRGDELGYFQPLGPRHWAFFADEGTTLLVTFETAAAIRDRKDGLPAGLAMSEPRGWSLLTLVAEGETWFRDPAVWAYFDRLVDDAFFEDFDRVVFWGAGMCGYAACAFSVTAPGAAVLAVNPRATLDPAIAGWDRRHLKARRLDFTSRYGYAPAMTEGTGQVFVLHDPRVVEDAMHAALFLGPQTTLLAVPMLGPAADQALSFLNLTPRLIEAAAEGTLTRASFARLWRARRNYGPWLRAMMDRAAAEGHPVRELKICRATVRQFNSAGFRKRLEALEARLGGGVPPAAG